MQLDISQTCANILGNMYNNIQVGDMIRVSRLPYNHVGIYVGRRFHAGRAGDVIHNDKWVGVVLSTLADFSGGGPVQVHRAATGNYFQREAVVDRALSLLGKRFDLLAFNCEHAANWAQTGNSESPQLQGLLVLVAIFGGLALLSQSK
jgi:hypothetical protein